MTKSSSVGVPERDLAADEVVERRRRPRRGCGSAGPVPRPARGRRSRQIAVVARAGRPALGPAPAPAPVCSHTSRRARRPASSVGRRPVDVGAVGLVDRLAVPAEPEPLHRVEDGVGELGPVALPVGVLDAQQESASGRPSEQPVEERVRGADRRGDSPSATERSGLAGHWHASRVPAGPLGSAVSRPLQPTSCAGGRFGRVRSTLRASRARQSAVCLLAASSGRQPQRRLGTRRPRRPALRVVVRIGHPFEHGFARSSRVGRRVRRGSPRP